jgi:hypothetical protein
MAYSSTQNSIHLAVLNTVLCPATLLTTYKVAFILDDILTEVIIHPMCGGLIIKQTPFRPQKAPLQIENVIWLC